MTPSKPIEADGAGKIKLYIWENVLTDYTSGMVAIMAHNLEEALQLARDTFPDYVTEGFAGKPYEVVTEPKAFYVYGGG